MVTLRGTNVYPTAVENVLGTVDGVSSNYEIHMTRVAENDEMEIRFEPDQNVAQENWATLAKNVSDALQKQLKVRIATSPVAPNSLPRYDLKTKRIFDNRPKGFQRALDR